MDHQATQDSEECLVLKATEENLGPRDPREKMENLEWRDVMENLEWMVPRAPRVETD